jgi:uncharacterized protein (UPF0332 family)
MSFDWAQFLKLANELAPRPINPLSEEAKLRSAISRAYYANHCKARNHLRDKEKALLRIGDNVHRFVIEQFLNSPDRTRKDLGKDLNRLRIERRKADYEDKFPGLAASAEVALRLAEKLMTSLDAL